MANQSVYKRIVTIVPEGLDVEYDLRITLVYREEDQGCDSAPRYRVTFPGAARDGCHVEGDPPGHWTGMSVSTWGDLSRRGYNHDSPATIDAMAIGCAEIAGRVEAIRGPRAR